MNTYNRGLHGTFRRRFWSLCDDLAWWCGAHWRIFAGGFVLGFLAAVVTAEIALGM